MAQPADSYRHRSARGLTWLAVAVGLIAASLLVTWHVWAAADFAYGFWHEAIAIDANIARYAPENRYRDDFQQTTPAERARLFGGIVDAIQGDTDKLRQLRYHSPDGRVLDRLLRPPEIRHLEDVAWLVGWFQSISIGLIVVALACSGLAIARGWRVPRLRTFASGAAVGGALVAIVLAVFGPTNVFYALHVWIFPPDHPWFFYYQDSLMSTMMRAPTLFGAIAAEWAITALLLFAVLLAAQRALHRRFTGSRNA